ncbi:NADPH-dependent diflavin oxidoreductase 1 [Cavenderia fasciculata]|uniref:NADPH-dependent diflavin oxidoreductase 1 n=1 Tax=Cavenderia fasciculata TaxID=261658 RepID=F4PW62_CACFS|nr:NADPH-dependent diflavin oxidoreductase 1 [Cavenderia fasciculata]EGG20226.1 NADPH-dependent diflavin oxidoreductase 1 [Cavenderia fasciculata]|eukprot:XP_004367209.1 NADPH-dependent diflavin oxidoreductase 1 [Cavenderia fasciculata]
MTTIPSSSFGCKIIYSTQSGTGQEVAEKLSRDLLRNGIITKVDDIENYDYKKLLPFENIILFVVSTQGHGDVPDSMRLFWNFLLIRSHPSNALGGLRFAILGLGDSSYTTFNFASKKLNQRLLSLGAQQLIRRGDADDQHDLGIDYEVEKWTLELTTKLHQLYPLPLDFVPIDRNILQKSKYMVEFKTSDQEGQRMQFKPPQQYSIVQLKTNQRITCPYWNQDVRHLEFDIKDPNQNGRNLLKYSSGDVTYILPENPTKSVNEIIECLKFDPNTIITSIKPFNSELCTTPQINLPTTIGILFKHYFDIMGSPRRYFFELLQFFTSDPLEQERLQYFSSTEGQDDLRDYNQKEKRNYIDVLKDFQNISIPFEYIFDLIMPIKPRPFSISSSSTMHPNELHVSAGLNTYMAPTRRLLRMGLCSQWFQTLSTGALVPMYIKQSGATLPPSPNIPLVMVGPGTGCAIFRSFMQHREMIKKDGALGEAIFYYGCRHANSDYLYQQEFEHYEKSGTISQLSVAFSRDSDDNKKVYVQHLMRRDAQLIWNLLENGAWFYISGSSGRMPKDF